MALLLRNGRMPQFKHRPTQFEQGLSRTIPAPYGGLNLRDDITALRINEARVLVNWRPTSGQLALRPGKTEHADDMGSGEVKTLAAYVGFSSQKLIAAAGGAIYDCTSEGSATQIDDGFAEDRWQTALYNNRLFLVNGTDAPQDYNGTSLNATSWSGSGLTIANLVNVALVRNRLWFCENGSADVWYGGIGSVTGTLTKFQLSQIAGGGYCMAVASWSRDGGDGADDLTVFVMSTGEIIVYQGDPASSFSLIGKYRTSEPVGRQCAFQVGGELVIITKLGLVPVSAAVGGVALDPAALNPWGKVAPGITQDATLHGGNAGWHGVMHEGEVFVNVPQTTGVLSKQWVMDLRTGAWTQYTSWNASSFASFGGDLYFGAQTGGKVFKATGPSDDGEDIVAVANGAFTFATQAQHNAVYTLVRPKMEAQGTVSGLIGVDTDFVVRSLIGETVELFDDPSLTPWGSDWGSPWGIKGEARAQWFSIHGEGRAVSIKMRAVGQTEDLKWYATDLAFKPGGIR